MKPGCSISKLKSQYCVIGLIQKRLSTEPLNKYSPVFQWATVRLLLIFKCILGLQSQSFDFTNDFIQVYITREEQVFIGLTRYFSIDGGNVMLLSY